MSRGLHEESSRLRVEINVDLASEPQYYSRVLTSARKIYNERIDWSIYGQRLASSESEQQAHRFAALRSSLVTHTRTRPLSHSSLVTWPVFRLYSRPYLTVPTSLVKCSVWGLILRWERPRVSTTCKYSSRVSSEREKHRKDQKNKKKRETPEGFRRSNIYSLVKNKS